MEMLDYLRADRVAILSGRTKHEALDELMSLLVKSAPGLDRDELERAVWAREEMMSTGIGQGLAIPHVRLSGLGEMTIVVGVIQEGIDDYGSLDNQPVRIIVLIAAPQGQHDAYIRLLAKITEVLKRPDLREAILRAETAEDIYRVFAEAGR